MIILVGLFYVYCIIGAVVGAICWMQDKWPKQRLVEDTVGGLASFYETDLNNTVLFALFCGPIFWVGGLFFIIFRWVFSLLKDEEN